MFLALPSSAFWTSGSVGRLSAADLLVEAHNKGLRGVRLLDVAVAADHELQRPGGRTPSEALAHVRSILPNVPTPRRP